MDIAYRTGNCRQVPGPFGMLGYTASIGVAIAHDSEHDLQRLLDAADAAVYAARSDGRNRVGLAAHDSISQRSGRQATA
jgi:PleD family two-component response regulator